MWLFSTIAMAHTTHTSWLTQFESDDRDFRFMATSDLLNELKKPTFLADETMQRRVCPDPSCLLLALCAWWVSPRVARGRVGRHGPMLWACLVPSSDALRGCLRCMVVPLFLHAIILSTGSCRRPY